MAFAGLSLCFSRSAVTSGMSFCMRFEEREAAIVKGTKTVFRSSVVTTMAQPQLGMNLWTQVMSDSNSLAKKPKKPNSIARSSLCVKWSESERRLYSFGPA